MEGSDSNFELHEALQRAVLGDKYDDDNTKRGIVGAANVSLYAMRGGQATQVGTAVVSNIGDPDPTKPQRRLHGHDIRVDGVTDMVVIRSVSINEVDKTVAYPYTFLGNEEVPKTLGDMSSGAFYVWDSRAMKPSSPTTSQDMELEITSVLDLGPIKFLEEDKPLDQETQAEEFKEDHGRKVKIRLFSGDAYVTKEVYVKIDQLVDVEHPLREVEQDHVKKLKACLFQDGFDYSVGHLSATPLKSVGSVL